MKGRKEMAEMGRKKTATRNQYRPRTPRRHWLALDCYIILYDWPVCECVGVRVCERRSPVDSMTGPPTFLLGWHVEDEERRRRPSIDVAGVAPFSISHQHTHTHTHTRMGRRQTAKQSKAKKGKKNNLT